MSLDELKLLIVEDDTVLGEMLSTIFKGYDRFQLVGIATNYNEYINLTNENTVDVAIVDIDLKAEKNGIDVICHCVKCFPETQILVHTIHEDSEVLFEALKSGANGYILKGSSPIELLNSLEKISRGEVPMSPKIARRVLSFFRNDSCSEASISPREINILELADKGYSYQNIADRLNISKHTVHTHFKNIYSKLKVNNQSEAIQKAKKMTLL